MLPRKVPQFFSLYLSVALLFFFPLFSFQGTNYRVDSPDGGDKRNRTADPLLAKQVLSQLSYTPEYPGVREWWSLVDSNHRPLDYQSNALAS